MILKKLPLGYQIHFVLASLLLSLYASFRILGKTSVHSIMLHKAQLPTRLRHAHPHVHTLACSLSHTHYLVVFHTVFTCRYKKEWLTRCLDVGFPLTAHSVSVTVLRKVRIWKLLAQDPLPLGELSVTQVLTDARLAVLIWPFSHHQTIWYLCAWLYIVWTSDCRVSR